MVSTSTVALIGLGLGRSLVRPSSSAAAAAGLLVAAAPAGRRTLASSSSSSSSSSLAHDDVERVIYRSPHASVVQLPTTSLYAHLFPPLSSFSSSSSPNNNRRPALDPDLPVFVDSSSGLSLTRAELERSSALLGLELVDRLRLLRTPPRPSPPSQAAVVGGGGAPRSLSNEGETAGDHQRSQTRRSPSPPTVGIFLANGLAWPVAFLACQRVGLPTALFASSLTPAELAHQLSLAKPGLTLTSTALASTLTSALALVDNEVQQERPLAKAGAATEEVAAAHPSLILPSPPLSGSSAEEEEATAAAAAAADPSAQLTAGEGASDASSSSSPFPTWSSLFASSTTTTTTTTTTSAEEAGDLIDDVRSRTWTEEEDPHSRPAVVCFSSGTEGLSKGVETTHANLTALLSMVHSPTVFPRIAPTPPPSTAAAAAAAAESGSAEHGDGDGDGNDDGGSGSGGMLAVLPFSHIYGLFKLVLMPLLHGFRAVVVPKVDLRTIGSAIERFRPSCAIFVPPILIHFAHSKALDRFDLSSLDWLLSGAAPLGKELAQAVEARFAHQNLTLLQGYGLTETSPVTHILQLTDARRHPGSIGRLIPNVEARLVDEDGKDAPSRLHDGKEGREEVWPEGELWVRGPNVMKGYLRNPLATEATFAPATDGGERWLKTGDIATVDPEGYFYIIDRRKELIKYNGHQVAPAELEALLLTHPQVADVGVIGVLSAEEKVEVPRAYVVLKPEAVEPGAVDEQAFAQAVGKWVQQRVAPHKFLRGGVHLIDQIPKSASGKILRRRLRDLARGGSS